MPVLSSQKLDELVMLTNDGSIVSKRSVERIYHPNDPQYLRFFVKKYQRRTPLVNRGYFLRMRLVDTMVSRFLSRPSGKTKVIVNLGCGSDPLPWRSMARHPELCKGVKFVDIDFPGSMALKCKVVEKTPELRQPLTNLELPKDPFIILTSDEYTQIACDLRRLQDINDVLLRVVDPERCEFFFVAEVSIAYMDVASADALIHWAGTLGDVEFCLLEQLAPDGLSHPFAHTMYEHFQSMDTPIHALSRYPTTADQTKRFRDQGWLDTQIWSLWEAWSDPMFMSAAERRALDEVEVFDEWEEFVNHASHYFLLHAKNGSAASDDTAQVKHVLPAVDKASVSVTFCPIEAPKSSPPRRFGAPLILKDVLGMPYVANFFGFGATGRMRSCDLYDCRSNGGKSLPAVNLHQGGPAARSCFTLTDIGDAGYLLAGGRASPATPFKDCWLFKKDTNQWAKTHDLPVPLYRQSTIRLGASQLVLLASGKAASSAIYPHYLLYHPTAGWTKCIVEGNLQPDVTFGSLLIGLAQEHTEPSLFHGILSGGMTADGLVSKTAYEWELDVTSVAKPTIRFTHASRPWTTSLLCRVGACSTHVDGWTVVAGGVTDTGSILQDREIVRFRSYGQHDEVVEYLQYVNALGPDSPRPVFVGASMISTGQGHVSIIGGGMATFSMATVWSKGTYTLDMNSNSSSGSKNHKSWRLLKTLNVTNEDPDRERAPETSHAGLASVTQIPHVALDSAAHFESILQSGKPVVFQGLNLGDCLEKWTLEFLAIQAGAERKVVVHASSTQAMDFLSKNFRYNTQTFQEFISDVQEGKKLYLRALSEDKPSDAPANLDADFPTIAPDFVLPPQLRFAKDKLFSSVLRISGPVNMWLHYDVLANIYCQIHGTKRFYLFPPSDVTRLGFAPGASSSSIDVFSSMDSSALSHCHPHEAVLGPGDVLFLPQLWLHTATPISTSSVAVNVFFRDLGTGYSAGRDVYGNRDLAAYEKARQDVSKISNSFKNLPRDTREFYLKRIADELLQFDAE
ncbi:leucine carboxyl methyltransferase [Ophiostoma piceae UAMH 11346]|uniref:tRNA wybutosine-synthesizing protein 4 n=1 Tax=Ophiostoma piceae (strain UAMH 11346) TaxID=1262450 RepID=S3C1R8_OPHP1|nr:leucine carboxyl methyltransferase [Ophiostoma piceae UAMH 11346]